MSDFDLVAAIRHAFSCMKTVGAQKKPLKTRELLCRLAKLFPDDAVDERWLEITLFRMLPADYKLQRKCLDPCWSMAGSVLEVEFKTIRPSVGCSPAAKCRPKKIVYWTAFDSTEEEETEMVAAEGVEVSDVKGCKDLLKAILDAGLDMYDSVLTKDFLKKHEMFEKEGFVFFGCDPYDGQLVSLEHARSKYPDIEVEYEVDIGDGIPHSWMPAHVALHHDSLTDNVQERFDEMFAKDAAFRRDALDALCEPQVGLLKSAIMQD